MRSLHDWFDSYGGDHQNPVNRLIHWFCVPAILWSVIAALWVVPVPASIGKPGLWCALVMVGVLGFYWRLSRPLGAAMIALFVALALLTNFAYEALGAERLLWLAIAVFVVAWIGQFIGHRIEGRRPSFLTDLAYLLIGPAWLVGKILCRLGIAC
ncbi:MAG TPA: Mpo1-like protein [Rhodanobacteraceae bacterium]|nr:Mpo1-like protein [Rhodanobacteraceae bacterium]